MFSRAQLPARSPHRHSPAPARTHSFKPFTAIRPPIQHYRRQLLQASGPAPLVYVEGYKEVEEVAGARLVVDSDTPRVEYLIKWKDGSEDTWEVGADLSEDLVRDFEEKWWAAARKADLDTMIHMLGGARELLANAVDENGRSALHFAAALGNADCCRLLLEAGADVDLQDKEGFTPLHMAAGYMHTSSCAVLLEGGANPELRDSSGRDVVRLVEGLRGSMPLSMGSVQRRLALEEVANCLTDRLYDEVTPAAVLNMRTGPDGSREFLVAFPASDGRDDEWVPESRVGSEVLGDFLAGLEYASAEEVLDVVQVGTERRFKIKWADGYPTSWEPEEHVPPELIALFASQQPQLFSQRTSAEAAARAEAAGGWEQLEGQAGAEGEGAGEGEYQTQATPLAYGRGAAAKDAEEQQSGSLEGLGGEGGNGDGIRGLPQQLRVLPDQQRETVGSAR
ncbi:hypothetical protein Agub_g2659 [Astrephomene gubernaculifera]|uniref:Chromo domain-containing protein n=1 Tax=Astrephomene gubernaculifera TaxID=47775 RepID=A0AAD3DHE2_9CHLO|nr:hypothetical protein Agub_g2659 [Astrephomene gubernaculifera]